MDLKNNKASKIRLPSLPEIISQFDIDNDSKRHREIFEESRQIPTNHKSLNTCKIDINSVINPTPSHQLGSSNNNLAKISTSNNPILRKEYRREFRDIIEEGSSTFHQLSNYNIGHTEAHMGPNHQSLSPLEHNFVPQLKYHAEPSTVMKRLLPPSKPLHPRKRNSKLKWSLEDDLTLFRLAFNILNFDIDLNYSQVKKFLRHNDRNEKLANDKDLVIEEILKAFDNLGGLETNSTHESIKDGKEFIKESIEDYKIKKLFIKYKIEIILKVFEDKLLKGALSNQTD